MRQWNDGRRTAVVIVVAALLGGGAGLGVWVLSRGDGAKEAGGTGRPSAAASGSVSPQGEGNTGAPSPSLKESGPASPGYVRSVDPAGYTVYVPSGWDRTAKKPQGKPVVVTYESPDGSRVLQLFKISENTPAESLDRAENQPDYGFGRLPGFQALDRRAAAGYSQIVYRFDGDGDTGPRRVVDHRFHAPEGTLYAVRHSAPESTPLDELREPVRTAVDSLCPTGATCVQG